MYLPFNPWLVLNQCSVNWFIKSILSFLLNDREEFITKYIYY
jgi:hypothetical protein